MRRLLVRTLIAAALLCASSSSTFVASQLPSGSVPGNGLIEPGEACDDGNLADGDGCSATMQVEQQCYDAGNTFSFFLWSDSYTSSGDAGIARVFADAVSRTKYPDRVIPRFWVSTGDIPFMAASSTRLDELNDAISNGAGGQKYPFACAASNGKFPYFVAVGNHDVDGYDTTTPESQYAYWNDVVGPKLPVTLVGISNFRWAPASGDDLRTTYSFDYKNAHFVIVNQYRGDPAYPTSNPAACIRTALHDWIDQDLASTTKPIRFVFGHEPSWSYCSNVGGYGGAYCPVGSIDNLDPPQRARPYSSLGSWLEPFGRHWGDSLEAAACPAGSRDAFWAMLARHDVVAHFVGHTHTYSARLVQGDGTRRNDVSAYGKTGQAFDSREGVWEVDTGQTHNSAGAVYVLATVRDNVVTFEAYDQLGSEAFALVEQWSVNVGLPPSVAIVAPATGAALEAPATLPISVDASDPDGSIAYVSLFADSTLVATLTGAPYTYDWRDVPAGTYQLTATAVDVTGISATSAPVTVVVNPASDNSAPTLSPIEDQAVSELAGLQFQATATDPDPGSVLTFSLVNAPAGATIDPVTGAFAWTPTEAQGPGTYRFTVRVRDNASPFLSADDSVLASVYEVNQPPVLAPIDDKTAAAGSLLTFTASAADADLPSNVVTYSLSGAPPGAAIDVAGGVFTWTPTSEQVGAFTFDLHAVDSGSPPLGTSRAVTVTITEGGPPSSGLVAAYAFEESSGSAATDLSAYGNTGAIVDAARTSAGKYGSGLAFNGTTAHVRVPDADSLDLSASGTIAVWMFQTAALKHAGLVHKGERSDFADEAYSLQHSDVTLRPSAYVNGATSSASLVATAALPLSAWQHVALTWDGTGQRLYVNGVLNTSRSGGISVRNSPGALFIGMQYPNGYPFQGTLDEVRIYNRALTQAEIQDAMNTPLLEETPDTTPPTVTLTAPVDNSTVSGIVTLAATASDDSGVAPTVQFLLDSQPLGAPIAGSSPYTLSWDSAQAIDGSVHTIAARASDDAGNVAVSSSATVTVSNPPPNQSPVAVASANVTRGAAPLTVSFSSQGSSDPDGDPIAFAWNFGDGSAASTSPNPAHTYSTPGTYTATLTVSDGKALPGPATATVAVTVDPPPPPPGPAGLVAGYGFEETSGTTVVDASGAGNNGALVNAARTTTGKYGRGLAFNGTNAYVRVPDASSLDLTTAGTIAVWMFQTMALDQAGLVHKGEMTNRGDEAYTLRHRKKERRPEGYLTDGRNSRTLTATSGLALSAWHHVALTWDSTGIRLYVNGVLNTSTTSRVTVRRTSGALIIGSQFPSRYPFQGTLDEVRIYDRSLTQSEIQSVMTTPLPTAP